MSEMSAKERVAREIVGRLHSKDYTMAPFDFDFHVEVVCAALDRMNTAALAAERMSETELQGIADLVRRLDDYYGKEDCFFRQVLDAAEKGE